MTQANIYFKDCIWDTQKLKDYGFIIKDDNYYLEHDITSHLTLQLRLDLDHTTSSFLIYDKDFNEEYFNYNIPSIRALWLSIFNDIKEHCQLSQPLSHQDERINEAIEKVYAIKGEYLFRDEPTFCVYRSQSNQKWFGLMMTIDYHLLDTSKQGLITIINLKNDHVKELINQTTIFPAYHMNKTYWISIVLNDCLDDIFISKLIDTSFNLVNKK